MERPAKLEKSEILEAKYTKYAWRKRTLARRLQYFDIKFTNYEVDIDDVKEAVRCEMELVVWYLIDSYVGMYFCCCLSISTEHYGSGEK